MLIYGLQKNGTDEPICRAEMETQTWKKQVPTGGGRRGSHKQSNRETYTVCKIDNQQKFLHDSGNSNQNSVTIQRNGMGWDVGGRFKKKGSYIYLCLNHADVWQKQHTIIKQLPFSLKKNEKEKQQPISQKYKNS